ncbi:MAG: DUF1667 domain-containing protein [Lentisphaeria bacterium]
MTKKKITCIHCPMGCIIDVELNENKILNITGQGCPRGEAYARQECTAPQRILTSSILFHDGTIPLSVRTDIPILKKDLERCLQEIRTIHPAKPVFIEQILKKNIGNTGANLIATRTLL